MVLLFDEEVTVTDLMALLKKHDSTFSTQPVLARRNTTSSDDNVLIQLTSQYEYVTWKKHGVPTEGLVIDMKTRRNWAGHSAISNLSERL
uniref:AlNc14C57G4315 protein n=1 Tax=Albugo laibachii Nc14 TaxID=890382 RepID=F0WCD5_9STRA|nr:AlNc14C57G4315 [Albugo laibachii Nc14]|eukprot:CCA18850.1 AlNc14C57G4315 [Albugo laibachii Nc14]